MHIQTGNTDYGILYYKQQPLYVIDRSAYIPGVSDVLTINILFTFITILNRNSVEIMESHSWQLVDPFITISPLPLSKVS